MKTRALIVVLICGLFFFAGCQYLEEEEDNNRPIANSGENQTVDTGSTVTLDGSGSSDADGDSLTYNWTIESKPSGSTATLSDSTAVNPVFTVDLDGTYEISLTVDDVE